MIDIPAYNEKEISMKDISFMFCADRLTASGGCRF